MHTDNPNLCAVVYDLEKKQRIEFLNTSLINQVSRESNVIGKTFDEVAGPEMRQLSGLYTQVSAILYVGMRQANLDGDDLRKSVSPVLLNTMNSLVAALVVLRSGFTLQPAILIRTCIESLALVLHLMVRPEDLEQFKSGCLKSQKTITTAKKYLPIFGLLYGQFSSKFTHVSEIHQQHNPLRSYNREDEGLCVNLDFLASGILLAYITIELTFISTIASPRYWKERAGAPDGKCFYEYSPDQEELAWLKDFINMG